MYVVYSFDDYLIFRWGQSALAVAGPFSRIAGRRGHPERPARPSAVAPIPMTPSIKKLSLIRDLLRFFLYFHFSAIRHA